MEDISVAIISNINQRCQCGLSRENITNGVFRCFPASPQAVTFRAILHRGAKASSSELASYIEHWIGSDVSIPVKSVLTNIDSSCMVIISSFDDRECKVTSEPPTNDNNNMSAAIIGGTVSCLLLFVILAGVMVVGLLWLRKRRLAYSKNMRYAELIAIVICNFKLVQNL